MAYLREIAIEQPLAKAVKKRGGIAYKLVSPGRRNVPDRLCIMPGGRIFFVECKAPGEKPRPGQYREMNRLRALGCEVYTLDSTNNDWLFKPAANEPHLELHTDIEQTSRPWKRFCEVEGCDEPHHAKGFCSRHYDRHRAEKRKEARKKE